MSYADYSYYTDSYKGIAIYDAEDFARLIIRASSYLDQITGGRAKTAADSDALKMAACAIAEIWQNKEQGGELATQSVAGWSRTFVTTKSSEQRMRESAELYLADTGLLSRWC